jgi:hypothetical protein
LTLTVRVSECCGFVFCGGDTETTTARPRTGTEQWVSFVYYYFYWLAS